MSSEIDRLLGMHQAALSARGLRSTVLASNIANADTPGYQARDIDFKSALARSLGSSASQPAAGLLRTSARHLPAPSGAPGAADAPLVYRTVSQASIDNNTVDVNVERAQFADNVLRYEASLTFINSKIKSLLAALQN
jgi:flagellar basal-body rod protein FlgB